MIGNPTSCIVSTHLTMATFFSSVSVPPNLILLLLVLPFKWFPRKNNGIPQFLLAFFIVLVPLSSTFIACFKAEYSNPLYQTLTSLGAHLIAPRETFSLFVGLFTPLAVHSPISHRPLWALKANIGKHANKQEYGKKVQTCFHTTQGYQHQTLKRTLHIHFLQKNTCPILEMEQLVLSI